MPSVRHYLDLGHLRRLECVVAVSPRRLGALGAPGPEYRYSAVDKSPLSRFVLRHWWTWTASLVPPWLAPNAITLIGFAAVVATFVAVALVCPTLEGSDSPWLWASCAAALFFYQTMDNIDGKQARRTGTSSPMGELFDHGCDALNTPLSALIQAAALGLGTSPLSLLCIAIACMSFFASTWEEYHTGTLYLGYINGCVSLLSKRSSWWSLPVGETFGSAPFLPASWRTNRLVVFLLSVAFLALHLPPWCVPDAGLTTPCARTDARLPPPPYRSLYNVHALLRPSPRRALTRPLGTGTPSAGTGAGAGAARRRMNATPVGEAFAQLLPIAGFCALAGAWALGPGSALRPEGRVAELVVVV
ncbi:hypothetical protein JCM3770_004345, partial [Rhodotorula araucariae]